uniref:Uncharacterized protein n=1 Tax=Nothobranchius rachovii TaxID=451742 RepID=A0A1A8S131_9TELE
MKTDFPERGLGPLNVLNLVLSLNPDVTGGRRHVPRGGGATDRQPLWSKGQRAAVSGQLSLLGHRGQTDILLPPASLQLPDNMKHCLVLVLLLCSGMLPEGEWTRT